MKRSLLLAFVLLPAYAQAQENYTVPATAGQATDLRHHVLAINRATCRRLNLVATCTQAQACVAANATGGASCTAAQARAARARIWPDSSAGREEYVIHEWIAPDFTAARTELPNAVHEDYCVWFRAQNQTTKDAECTKIGAPTGCNLCP